jgi:hypothetical protein
MKNFFFSKELNFFLLDAGKDARRALKDENPQKKFVN